jgi:hypothetical protein
MMEDLVRHFVSEPWVDDLDFSAMTPIKTKYRAHGLPKRDSDIVWGPKSRDGGWSGLVWSDLSEFV